MAWGIVASVGGSLLGGLLSSKSASKAADTQAAAAQAASAAALQGTRESNQLTRDIYLQTLRNQAPNLRSGQLALSALQSGLGLGAATKGYTPPPAKPTFSGDVPYPSQIGSPDYTIGDGKKYPTQIGAPMAQMPVAAPQTYGTYVNAQGVAVDAEGNPVEGPGYDAGLGQMGDYGATEAEMAGAGEPYAGTFQEQFTGQDLYKDPSYQFRLDEGMRALRAQQAAGGNRFSGQAMKDITNYGQGAASQEYQAGYGRFMANKEALYNRLSNLAGLSSSTAGSLAGAGATAAGQMGSNIMAGVGSSNQYLTSGANAQASGTIGSTNALVGGINTAAQNYWMQDYLKNKGNP